MSTPLLALPWKQQRGQTSLVFAASTKLLFATCQLPMTSLSANEARNPTSCLITATHLSIVIVNRESQTLEPRVYLQMMGFPIHMMCLKQCFMSTGPVLIKQLAIDY